MSVDTITIGLGDLGLTSDESAAYLNLLRRCSFTPGELSLRAGIPRQLIDDIIDSLEAKGLCGPGSTPWRTVVALEPRVALAALTQRRLSELESLRQRVQEKAGEMAESLQIAYEDGCKQRDSSGYVEIYRDPVQISTQLRQGFSDDALVREWVTLALAGTLARVNEEGDSQRRDELLQELRELQHGFPEDVKVREALTAALADTLARVNAEGDAERCAELLQELEKFQQAAA